MAEVLGIPELRARIAAEIISHRAHLVSELDAIGRDMVERIRAMAPSNTGALAKSVRHEIVQSASGAKLLITVGNDRVYYAPYLEFGTSRMSARPFVRPVVYQEQRKVPSRVSSTLSVSWEFE